ncbi:MAG: hypothetical protein Q9M13_04965, partial [Mariprofundales bacterium]|nr:hypothetical protein [Mariprofundales bacterium]
ALPIFFMDAQYPRVLDETGLFGFVAFIWLLRRFWVLLRRCYHQLRDPELKGAALGVLCGYGGLLVHAIGANTFIIVRIMEPFMILMGLLLAALIIEEGYQQRVKGEKSVDTDGNADHSSGLAMAKG